MSWRRSFDDNRFRKESPQWKTNPYSRERISSCSPAAEKMGDHLPFSDYLLCRKWEVYYDDMFRGYAKYHLSDFSDLVEEHLPELRLAGLKRLLDRRFFDLEYVSTAVQVSTGR